MHGEPLTLLDRNHYSALSNGLVRVLARLGIDAAEPAVPPFAIDEQRPAGAEGV